MFEFPEKIEKLADVPEPFRSLYAEEEGGFQLNEQLASRLNMEPLQQQISTLESEKDTLTDQLQRSKTQIEQMEQHQLREQAEQEIRKTVIQAGGAAELLLPHILGKAKIGQGKDGLELRFDEQGGETKNLDTVLEEMKKNPHLALAFKQNRPTGGGMSPSSVSGLHPRISRQDQQAVNAHIEEIATGKISLSD